mmetsp:Transcript_41656/g.116292  ORF Transcript_41656/g.116292 Transcript_41656/m.116292 type:complete len:358 (-) Transcript_41656:317-1390(-)
MRTIFLRFLCHETYVGAGAHGLRIKSTMLLAKLDHFVEDDGIPSIRNGGHEILLLVVLVPHLPAAADRRRHRIINDDVAGHVQIRDAFVGIHHGHVPALGIRRHDVVLDGLAFGLWQRRDFLVHVTQTVVGVNAELGERPAVLRKHVLEVDLHAVPKHDRVGHLHHGGLEVQREEHPGRLSLLDGLLVEGAQRLAVHEGAVYHISGLERQLLLQHGGRAIVGTQLDPRGAGRLHGDGALVRVEVAVLHAPHDRLRACIPLAHGVRVPERVLLHWHRSSPVGVALPQHRVDRASKDLPVAVLDALLAIVPGLLGVVGHGESLALQLLNALLQLRHRSADVRELDDVRLPTLGQQAELG